ncbi:PA14 domain-containing protein [Paenibacillus sp. HWE-109]|uniref:glycosyl hydrolase n=1 Tax=Paenibacillus sp. HWE-109 TaxID=1306526 RepID=UPI001EDE1FEF|nr:glycosyl hydrolase [Paenibacillus sp. HWE-109]UKS29221.1 PA14 domain-containing protein [Paenibacillus sp. HWE-109]
MLKKSKKVGVRIKVTSLLFLLSLLSPHLLLHPDVSNAATVPINSQATLEAKVVLQQLYAVSGLKTISGQHDYLESPDEWNNRVKGITGKYPSIHGYELGAIMNQTASEQAAQRENVVNSAIAWHQAGGLVTISYHENIPGTCLCWANVKKEMSQADFDKYVTPGTPQYNQLIADLDKTAVYLGKLKDAGVPVLWRPYHESNGGWFWWGKKTNFSALWNLMYERFVQVHKLNNLLWVWSPNAPNASSDPYNASFPGISKVDVLAVDIYDNDYNPDYYNKIVELAAGKPIAIGENGELPSQTVLSNQSKWAYFMTWGKMLSDNNGLAEITSSYANPRLLTRETFLSDLLNAIVPAPSPAPVPKPETAPVVARNGLRGEYYDNKDLTALKEVREDRKIDFNWSNAAPFPSMQADTFSVRWTGKLKPKYTENYQISTLSDDGIRVWVNGELVIDSWFNQSWVERKGSIALQAGVPVDFKVEYYDNTNGAVAKVSWESQSQTKQLIPDDALFLP